MWVSAVHHISHSYAFNHIHGVCVILIIWVRFNSGTFQIKAKFHISNMMQKIVKHFQQKQDLLIMSFDQQSSTSLYGSLLLSPPSSIFLMIFHASIFLCVILEPTIAWSPRRRGHGLRNYDPSPVLLIGRGPKAHQHQDRILDCSEPSHYLNQRQSEPRNTLRLNSNKNIQFSRENTLGISTILFNVSLNQLPAFVP